MKLKCLVRRVRSNIKCPRAGIAAAEALAHVRVCDAYGTGYFYIPGTETCVGRSPAICASNDTAAATEAAHPTRISGTAPKWTSAPKVTPSSAH